MNRTIQRSGKIDQTCINKNAKNNKEALLNDTIENRMKAIISSLPDKERLIIALYFYEKLTTMEISKLMKLSEPRISQMLDNCLTIINKKTFMEN